VALAGADDARLRAVASRRGFGLLNMEGEVRSRRADGGAVDGSAAVDRGGVGAMRTGTDGDVDCSTVVGHTSSSGDRLSVSGSGSGS
jgi:hypothetical protein